MEIAEEIEQPLLSNEADQQLGDPIEQYYNYLKKSGADIAPTLQSFKNTLSDEKSAKQYYDYLKKNNYDAPDTYESFSKTLGVSKSLPPYIPPNQRPVTDHTVGLKIPTTPIKAQLVTGSVVNNTGELVNKLNLETAEKHAKIVNIAHSNLQNYLDNSDDVAREFVANDMINKRAQENLSKGIDNTGTKSLVPIDVQAHEKENLIASIPQSDIDMLKKNPENSVFLIQKKADQLRIQGKTKEANQLKSDLYAAQSDQTANSENTHKIINNVEAIKKGDLDFKDGQLIKYVYGWQSVATGFETRTKEYDLGHSLLVGSDEDNIKKLNEEINAHDPNEPVPIPKGLGGTVGHFVGDQGLLLAKGIGSELIPVAGTAVAAGLTGEEMGMRSYGNTMLQSFAKLKTQLKQQHPDWTEEQIDQQAYSTAKGLARDAGALDFVLGAGLALTGGAGKLTKSEALWSKEALEASKTITPVAKSALQKVSKGAVEFAGNTIKFGVPNAAAAGAVQGLKNADLNAAGIKTDLGEGVVDAAAGMLGLHMLFHGLTTAIKGGAEYSSVLKNKLMQGFAKVPLQDVNKIADGSIQDGTFTPAEVKAATLAIKDHQELDAQIPDRVKNDNVRLDLQKKILSRAELEEKLKNENKAFAPETKEKIKALDEDIVAISKTPEAKKEVPELPEEANPLTDVVQRIEEPGMERATIDKPHGIYTTPADVESPHEHLGGDKYYWKLNPEAKVLDIDEVESGDVVIRKGAINAAAGVHAVKKLLGEEAFSELRKMSKQELIKYAEERYKNIDFNKYYDKQEIIETIGAQEAKKAGYDIIKLTDKKDPAFSETVLLSEKAAKEISSPKISTNEKAKDAETTEKVSTEQTEGVGKNDLVSAPSVSKKNIVEVKANEDFNKHLDDLIQKKLPGKVILNLGEPGDVLKKSGLSGGEIRLPQRVINEKSQKHGFDKAVLKDLPNAINNPLLVYDRGNKSKSHLILTELEHEGNKVMVAIGYEKHGNKIDINNISSIYPKDVQRFIDEVNPERFEKEDLKYANKEKALDWLRSVPTQGEQRISKQERIANIIENFEKSKSEDNASTIRSDQEQVPEAGNAAEGSQETRGNDLQSHQVDAPINGETKQQEGNEITTAEDFKSESEKIVDKNPIADKDISKSKWIGKKVDIAFAGGKESGEVIEDNGTRVIVQDSKGIKYPVKYKNILKDGESLTEHYDNKKKGEVYSNYIGSKPTNTGRIPVDPIVGQSPKEISKIIGDVSASLKQRLFYSKVGKRAAGSYSPSNAGIKIRFNGDLDTTAHEIGHAIDDKFGIYLEAVKDKGVLKEISNFAKHGGSQPPKGHPDPIKYKFQEGLAEFVRGLVVNPDATEKAAPKATELYKRLVDEKVQKSINSFSNDIRVWAGASGKDIIMSNIQMKPAEKKDILGTLFNTEKANNEFSINWVDRLAANFVNPLRAFEKAYDYARGIKGVDEVLPENDPVILSRVLLGIDGKFGDIIQHGMIDGKLNVLKDAAGNPKNLQWLLEPLDNTDVATITQEMKDVISYMVAERTVELNKKFGRENILTGIGGGIFKDVDVAKKALDEFNNGDPDKLSRIKEATDRYREFSDDVLRYAVEKGRMSPLDYQNIKDNNLQYVALQRVLETEPGKEIEIFNGKGGKKLATKADIIQTIKGSTKAIQNPYNSLLNTLYKTIRESDRNDVLRAFRDMVYDTRQMSEGKPNRLSDIGVMGKEGDKEAIPVFVNGKPERWIFQKDIYKALKGLDHDGYKLPGILTAHAKLLRFTTTQWPTFAVRNWIRDLQDRLIKSGEGSGFKDLIGNKGDWNAVAKAGGLNSGYYFKDRNYYNGLLKETMSDLAENKKFILADPVRLKELWHSYENLLYKSETSNRVAEYRAGFRNAQKRGMDNYNSALYGASKARDLVDFAIAGHYMKIINQIIPFSNAAVQGLRSGAMRLKENPVGFLGRMAAYSVLPGMAAWWWNHKDEDTAKEYENLPAYQRDMFWNFKIGDNKWLTMPKPYELSLTGAGIDRLLSQQLMGNKEAFKGYGGSVAKSLLPFDEGNIAGPGQPFIESMTNYDFFRNKSIIPPHEEPLNLALRNTETASRLGQLIQRAAGVDARKIDHFIQSQFSYMGRFGLKLSDIGANNNRNEFDLTDLGLFKRSPAYNSAAVQEMMQFAKEWQLTSSSEYKKFNKKVGEYFDASTDKEKEEIGQQLIEESKEMTKKWEEKNLIQKKTEKAEEKKNPTLKKTSKRE